MDTRWKLWVEGPSDKALVRDLLRHMDVANVETAIIGGGVTKIANVAPLIRESGNRGFRVALILDADSDYKQLDADVTKEIDRLELPIERYFLFPDNEHSGSLETLLERMAAGAHRVVYGCLDEFEECLRNHDRAYRAPEPKGRIYAYCEALGIETNASRRCYDDSSHWDLDAPVLEPLKRFLQSLC